ncbi:MAG: sodium/proline symporter [Gemmatimonadota bacterium]
MEEGLAPVVYADAWAVTAFVGYLLLLIGIGALSVRFSSEGIGNFFVGGRRMNRWVVALSAVVSGRSAWLLLGVTGMAWTMGVSAIWAVVGYTTAELILFLTLAKRLRRLSGARDCVTVTDVFAERLGDRDGRLRMTLSAVILLFMVAYVSAQFVGGGKAMGASFGLSPQVGIVLTALIVLGYTTVGGFLAVSLTDSLQAGFMIFGLLAIPAMALSRVGGWGELQAELVAWDPSFMDPLALGAGVFIGLVGIGLGSPGNPHILVRYMSISDAEQLRFAAWTGTAANALMGVGAVMIGVVGRVLFPEIGMLGEDTENLYPFLARETLHPALFGVVVASIFAAIMSTADSQLLVGASAVVRDIYQKILRKGEEVPEKRLILLSRILVTGLVVSALILGWAAEELVFWLVLFAWAGLGAALGPTLILTLYWRRTTRAGVMAGVLTGAAVTIIWYLVPALKAAMYELVPGVLAGTAVTIAVSLLTTPPDGVEALFATMEDGESEELPVSMAEVATQRD